MNRLRLILLALALTGSIAGGALAATQSATILPLPRWLPAAEKHALDNVFGSARPIHTYYVSYPRKVAVIFEFNHVVFCRTCSAPTNASIPHGKVIRVSFDRHTHRLNSSMQFCESRDTKPSLALCIHR